MSTVVESLLIILCLYCIYKCIRRPHNIWRCRTVFLPCARTVLVRCFVYFDNFSEVNFCVLCCSVREHTFGFDSCGVVGPRVSGMWTVQFSFFVVVIDVCQFFLFVVCFCTTKADDMKFLF